MFIQTVIDTTAVVVPTTGNDLINYLVTLGVGSVIGSVVKLWGKASTFVAGLASPLQLAITAILAYGTVKLGAFLHIQLPPNTLGWDAQTLTLVLTTASAMGMHVILAKKPAATS